MELPSGEAAISFLFVVRPIRFSKSTGLAIPSASVPAPTVVDDFNPVGNGLPCGITASPSLATSTCHSVFGAHPL